MTKTAFNWRQYLPVHPAAELFPLMSQVGLKELADDIKANGLIDPIVTWAKDGNLRLDGRNRLDAMALAGLLGVNEEGDLCDVRSQRRINLQYFTDGDPYAIALSLNVHRRHLTNGQKRDLIAKLLKAQPEKSNRTIASAIKADHKTVGSVRAEQEATGEIPQLKKIIGKDGKSRQVTTRRKTSPATKTAIETANKPAQEDIVDHVLRLVEQLNADQRRRLFARLDAIIRTDGADDVECSAEKMKAAHAARDMAAAVRGSQHQIPADLSIPEFICRTRSR